MKTLFSVNINWVLYFTICASIYLIFPDLSWYSFVAIAITLHQFFLLFYSIGNVIPIRYLFGSLMCLQMFLGPTFAFNGLDHYQYGNNAMQIPEEQYFSYVIPAVICFLTGLHITSSQLKGEQIDIKKLSLFISEHPDMPYVFIGIGFLTSIASNFMPSTLAFVFYLLGDFKYIGTFMLIMSGKKLKIVPLLLVFGSIIISSLGTAMFHDLIIWLFFLSCYLSIRYKPSDSIKILVAAFFILLSVVIQLTKGDYRDALREGKGTTGVETFTKAYEQNKGENSFIDYTSLAKNNLRINQGYIITHVMKTVPQVVPFSNGEELSQIVQTAILPRIIAPDKLNAGDQQIFMKYTGLTLNRLTSMALSSVGDAYLNFGVGGGSVFMFFLGLFYSEVLKAFSRYSKYFPALILFIPLVFYYPIRPDCELQTILGHLVKSCFLLIIVFQFKRNFFAQIKSRENVDVSLA